jgi:ATP-dependent Clp protease, protease subunit
MEDNNNNIPQDIWCTLAGPIDQAMVQRVFNSFALAIREEVKTVHLLVQSSGGFITDGISLYNYLSNLPVTIIAYNPGGVLSIAVVVFLAAKRRIASDTATFMIHKTHTSPQAGTTAATLNAIANGLNIDNHRVETILHRHITMSEDKWSLHQHSDLTITAEEAMQFGLIHEIANFAPPPDASLYNI